MFGRLGPICLALGLGAVLGTGCQDDQVPADDAGGGGQEPASATLVFQPSTTLTMRPGETVELDVASEPRGVRRVDFGLISSSSSGLDASLDPTATQTDSSGLASTTLRAPSVPGTFSIRAWLDADVEARRAVSVSAEGFGSLRVYPDYSGKRKLGTWTASVRTDTTCGDLPDLLHDGPLVATGKQPLTIDSVPVGPSVTITVRAGELAAGCLTVPRLEPDELRDVHVTVTDLPLRVDEGELAIDFGISPQSVAFAASLSAAEQRAATAFNLGQSDDASTLLTAWLSTLGSSEQSAFQANIDAHDLTSVVSGQLSSPTALRDLVHGLLDGASALEASNDTFQGLLTFGPQQATFVLDRVATVDAQDSGFVVESKWSASIEPGDVLVLGGTLSYQPAAFVCALAAARAETAGDDSPEVQLGTLANCADLGAALVAEVGGALYPGCSTAAAAEQACQAALGAAWASATNADRNASATLAVAMSGRAGENSSAQIVSYAGTWLGTAQPGGIALGGDVQGTATEP